MRAPHADEKCGSKPQRACFGFLAVSHKWRDPHHPVFEVAVLRGIHMDNGYFEASMSTAMALTTELTLNTMQLFPELALHMRQSYRRIFKKPTQEELKLGLYKWGVEINLVVSCDLQPTFAQDDSLKKQLLDNLGMVNTTNGRKQWAEHSKSGMHFMFCTSTLTAEYANNYPQAMLRPRAGPTTAITNANSTSSLRQIIKTLQWAEEVEIENLERIFVKRGFANDDNGVILPSRTANGSLIESRSNTIVLEWFQNKTPGRFSEKTMKSLAELSRGGAPLGTHEAIHDTEPSVIQMRNLNTVINMNLKAKGVAPLFLAEAPKIKKNDTREGPSEETGSGMGMLKLRPWNKASGADVAMTTPCTIGKTLRSMDSETARDLNRVTAEHQEQMRDTPSMRYRPQGGYQEETPKAKFSPHSLMDRMTGHDAGLAPGPVMLTRSAFAYDSGGCSGHMIRGEAPRGEQALTSLTVQTMIAQAAAQREADMNTLRTEMQLMQNNNQTQITKTVVALLSEAFESDTFAMKIARAVSQVTLELRKQELAAQFAPDSEQGNQPPQRGDHR